MSKQVIQMKYHPAKKEVEFHRFQSGTEVPIPSYSRLAAYINMHGRFVLQDHGNDFFKDIAEAFDGERIINMEVITTKNDYEDFLQMAEFFNNDSDIQINATLLSELPDMNATYRAVKEHGEQSMSILKSHKTKFFDIDMKNPVVKKVVEKFSEDVQKEVDSINAKINALAENNVNLCFAGVYSAGKSALINAILGYAILPENINSETARMFRIQSPRSSEKIRIVFTIRDNYSEIIWDENKSVFEFAAGPVESSSRSSVQDIINQNRNEPQHKQIYEILKVLNSDNDISADIKVFFPIPLDSDKVQFTIYDTPGTDSNYGEHQIVLQDALSEQTHSILVFVAAPNKTEGEGNNALLNYLKKAEEKDSKTSIDIGRSLFVINWADSIGPEERINLQKAEIKDKDNPGFSIKLSDKKLFFTSAKIAYAAKSKKNNIATKSEEFTIRQQSDTISDSEFGRYYQQNHCATSECSTKRMIELSNQALKKAENENDILEVLHVCSGVYALENEITLYGEKFAAAVRAFAIIDSVDKALSKLNTNAQVLENQNNQDIDKINIEISDLQAAITNSVKTAYDEHFIEKNEKFPDDILKELHLDSQHFYKSLVEEPKKFIDKLLQGWFFGLGKVRFNKKHKQEITQKVTSVVNDFFHDFSQNSQRILEKKRDAFIKTVKEIINSNGNLSDEAKTFVLNISVPEVKNLSELSYFGDIYDKYKNIDHVLFWDFEYIDKDGLIEDIDRKLTNLGTKISNNFREAFRDSLTSILNAIEAEYLQNLDKYSVLMKAKLEDKKAMQELGERIRNAASDLTKCQAELNQIIWGMKNDNQ